MLIRHKATAGRRHAGIGVGDKRTPEGVPWQGKGKEKAERSKSGRTEAARVREQTGGKFALTAHPPGCFLLGVVIPGCRRPSSSLPGVNITRPLRGLHRAGYRLVAAALFAYIRLLRGGKCLARFLSCF